MRNSAPELHVLTTEMVADRLSVSVSTLSFWLRDDASRPSEQQRFAFHRHRGRARFWSENSYLQLEEAIHRESLTGVLSGWRSRKSGDSPNDPDAEAALNQVLDNFLRNRKL